MGQSKNQKHKLFVYGLFTVVFTALLVPADVFPMDREQEDFYNAAKNFSEGYYGAAVAEFQKFIESYPQSRDIYEAELFLARCFYKQGKFRRAARVLDALAADRRAAAMADRVYYRLAETHNKLSDFRKVSRLVKIIITRYPASKFYWPAYGLGVSCSLKLGRPRQAEKYLEKIISGNKYRGIIDNAYALMWEWYYKNNDRQRLKALSRRYLNDYPKGKARFRAYYYTGELFYSKENYDKAVENYARALALSDDPDFNDSIYQRLGFCFIAKGQYLEAKSNIDNIRGDEFRLYSLGMAYWKIKEYGKALEVIDALLKQFPQGKFFNNIYLNKAAILYEMGRTNDAMFLYRHILTFSSDDYEDMYDRAHYGLARCFLRGGDFAAASREFKLAIKYTRDPLVKLSAQVQVADNFYDSGNFKEALALYDAILKDNDRNEYADYILFQKENIYLKTSRWDEARKCLGRLQKKHPDSKILAKAQYNMAAGYFSQNLFDKAEELLRPFTAAAGGSGEVELGACRLYVKCLLAEKKYKPALEALGGLSEKFRDSPQAGAFLIETGTAYAGLSLWDEARESWETFLQRFGNSPFAGSAALLLAGAYEKDNDFPAAEEYYRQAAARDKSLSAEAFFSLGAICLARLDFAPAQDYFQKLKSLDSGLFLKARLLAARAYAGEGRPGEAVAVFDEIIKADGAAGREAALEKAIFLKGSQDYKQAAAAFREAIDMGVDSAMARFSLGMCLEKTGDAGGALEHYSLAASFGDKDYAVKAFFRAARIYEEQGNIELAKKTYRDIIKLNTAESGVAREKLVKIERR